MQTILKSIFVVVFVVLPILAYAGADVYYVTQNGAGAKNGTSLANAWSVSQFNALSGTGYAGDTFYFSGTITSTVYPRTSGTSGNYVTLDGYEGGDCDPFNFTCSSSALLTGSSSNCAMWVDGGNDYLTIQDFRMTSGNLSIYTASGSAVSSHITIQHNYIYDTNDRMFNMWEGSAASGPSYVTIDGNKMVGFGKSIDTPGGVQLRRVADVIVKNNIFGHTGSTQCTSANVIEVHNSNTILFEYNEIYGAPQQAGIAVKEYGSNNIIIRFNNIHDNDPGTYGGRSIGVNWPDTYNIYIYGNLMYNNSKYGIDLFDGCHDIYIWSNLIYNNVEHGLVTWFASGRGHDSHVENLVIYNNVFANNGTDITDWDWPDHTGIALKDSEATNIVVKNNILYNNRPNAKTYNQVYSASSTDTLEHNQYFYTGQTPTIYWNGEYRTLATMQTEYGKEDDNPAGKVEDPDFTDAGNNNYALNAGSAVINGGADLSGLVGSINVQGTTYCMYYEDCLYDAKTYWSISPPTVTTVKQDDFGSGWERGAYVYAGGQFCQPPTNLRRN